MSDTLTVSQLNDDGVFQRTITLDFSDRDPLEPDKFLIPGGCVEAVPKDPIPFGYVAVWDRNTQDFVVIPDPYKILKDKFRTPGQRLVDQTREVRNQLLADSDWTQLADTPPAIKKAWKAYRAALRALPEQEGFPESVEWPVAPDMAIAEDPGVKDSPTDDQSAEDPLKVDQPEEDVPTEQLDVDGDE